MTQLTDKEQVVVDRFEKYLYEAGCSPDMVVSMLKLIFEYSGIGSASYLAGINGVTPQYINRTCDHIELNGIRFYLNDL